jgi:hypothetical protein
MERFFEPAVRGIVEEVGKRFEALQAAASGGGEPPGIPEPPGGSLPPLARDDVLCDYLFLVGGFAESPLLQQRIRTAFGHRVRKVVVPEAPSHAVLSGAVSYGLDPSQIRARRSRLTYGCAYIADFDPQADDPAKRVRQRETGKDRARDRFYVFVRAGDEIGNQPVVQTFTPFQSDAASAVFALYATAQRTVRYIDEEGVRQIGKVSVTVPNINRGLDRQIELSMSFGGTEITVEARALPSGEPVTATVDFASTYLPEEVGD